MCVYLCLRVSVYGRGIAAFVSWVFDYVGKLK